MKKRGFAAARSADDGHEFTVLHGEIDAIQRLYSSVAAAVIFFRSFVSKIPM